MSFFRVEGLPPWSLSVLEDALLAIDTLPLLEVPTWLIDGPRLTVAPWSSSAGPEPSRLTGLRSWTFAFLLFLGWTPALWVTVLLHRTFSDLVPFSMAIMTDHRAFLSFPSPFFSFWGIKQVLVGLNVSQCRLYLLIRA